MKIENKKINTYCGLKMFSLEGRIAVVTGAGSGLGHEIAAGLAMVGAGVVLTDKNTLGIRQLADDLNEKGFPAEAIQLDVTSQEEVTDVVRQIVGKYDRIDVLVNCAGITRRMPLEDFSETDWDSVLDVNLKGTFLLNKIVGKEMLREKKGSIINFGSLGSVVAIPNSVAYCSSKGGVAMLTKTAAVEWAKKGVRVNAVIPGTFETALLKQCIEQNPAYEREMLQRFPIGRFGKPEEIVGACIFLASDASSYVTGHLLYVDGGCIAY